MQVLGKHTFAIACAAALCLLLTACDGSSQPSDGRSPFPTSSVDELPQGARIDVSAKNLFQMGSGDFWTYNVIRDVASSFPTTTRRVVADDGAGHVSLEDNDDGVTDVTPYTVTADGLLNTQPLGDAPVAATAIAGAILDYATPLYPVGTVRRHVRSGPWGEDLDGDGIGESFSFEYTQVFLGFETLQFSALDTLSGVAHFRNVVRFTLRPTARGQEDVSLVATEEAWFAPGVGLVQAQRVIVDDAGRLLELPHTLVFAGGTVGGAIWDLSEPPPLIGGSFVDVPLKHNALVYDATRNVYYASVPASVANDGSKIATIDPATGQASFSAVVGADPGALALAADASVLYVGLSGTSELLKLALPAMTELGRVGVGSPFVARSIAVSPVDPDVVAVSRSASSSNAGDAGLVLFRGLVAQPKSLGGAGVAVFDQAGTTLYGLNSDGGSELRRIRVLADGVVDDLVLPDQASGVPRRAIGIANNRVIAGHMVYNAQDLTLAGTAPSQGDCQQQRSANRLLCLSAPEGGGAQPRIFVVDSDTFVIKALPLYAGSEPASPRRFVEGPAGQIAISYQANAAGFPSRIRLFTSDQLLAPPTLTPPAWLTKAYTTRDGSALSLAMPHNALVYDAARNAYYATIPGAVAGFGNSVAVIDPASAQVAYSAPVGSEPNAIAIAFDGSALYVGLDGSGEVVKLALPSMTEQGRARLPVAPFFGVRTKPLGLAVSPVDPNVAAVATSSGAIVLLRGMAIQPRLGSGTFPDRLVFDSDGAMLYAMNDDNAALDQLQVETDGLTFQKEVRQATLFAINGFSFASGRVIMGSVVYDAPALTVHGAIPNTYDCRAARAGTTLLCRTPPAGSMLVADAATLATGPQLLYALSENLLDPPILVQGPSGQIAFDYTGPLSPRSILFFSSAALP